MASITTEANGCRRILFTGADGKRRAIYLGKVKRRTVEAVKVRVEELVTASVTRHSVDDVTAAWVASLDDVMRDKLAAVGLIPKREAAILGSFADQYAKGRPDWGAGMLAQYGLAVANAKAFFGADRRLTDITPADGDKFRAWLVT